MKIFILGANGFIGNHLCEAILAKTNWQISAIDLADDKLSHCHNHSHFQLKIGDMTQEQPWVNEQIAWCDVVIPLVAIATPATYVEDPLRVFNLDFEANLTIIRECVRRKKRIIFPSTSEVYGMCSDQVFDEETSPLVTGPIHKERWIYSTSKQLLDRLIYAYGKHHNLEYSLFRPFNWYGPRLDQIHNKKAGGSRVLTQFIGNILRNEPIYLVDGGLQKRCFTFIDDGIAALLHIIENKNNMAFNRIFNIGNPTENISIRELAEKLVHLIQHYFPKYAALAADAKLLNVDAAAYYGTGYQDVSLRVPAIHRAQKYLGWEPKVGLEEGLKKTLAFYLE